MNPATQAIALISVVLFSTISIGVFEFASGFVSILSPSKAEVVPAGSTLVSGTSDDNAQSVCKILVIVNSKYPYQRATATGPSGPGDFSTWTYTAELDEGINKITAKASCGSAYEPSLVLDPPEKAYVKHYSINVTGISSAGRPGLEEPSVPLSPAEDSGDQGDEENGSEVNGEGDEDSTSD
jgi:hypothetical protein